MNSNLEMFINKLQMLASTTVSNKHKFVLFIQWNESNVLKEAKKILKQGFSNTIVDQWLHKATFWS
jgi:ribose 5-phosphate isomerase RpiB